MRWFLLIPLMIIGPMLLFSALKMVTGDALSAMVFGLTLLVTVVAWLAGPSASAARHHHGS